MNETKDDLKREKVRIVPISNIEDFPDHPFQVKDDESMDNCPNCKKIVIDYADGSNDLNGG